MSLQITKLKSTAVESFSENLIVVLSGIPICIQQAILLVNWYYAYSNKTADEKGKSLNKMLLNIFRKFFLTGLSNSTISISTG